MKDQEAFRPQDAAEFIALSPALLERCRAAGWIKPLLRQHRITIYRRSALLLLLNRIEREGLPPDSETPAQHPVEPATV